MALAVLLASCGGGGGDGDTVSTMQLGTIERVAIMPGSVLLTGTAESRQLTAKAFDANGNELAADITWSSTHPDHVQVDETGRITSFTTVGSTQIVAEAAGVRSAPVLVTVATPAAGAVLVSDAQIVGPPQLVDPAAPFDVGSRYRVTLTGVQAPALNSILLGTETTPVGGRVVDVQDDNGQVVVTLEMVPIKELFRDLVINETIDLSMSEVVIPADVRNEYDITTGADGKLVFTPKDAAIAPEAGPASLRNNVMPQALGDKLKEFKLGPFDCKTEIEGPNNPLKSMAAPSFTLAHDIDVNFHYDSFDGGFQRLTATGSLNIELKNSSSFNVAFEGKVTCQKQLAEIDIPVSGLWALVFGGHLPLGAGFEISGKIIAANIGVDMSASAGASLELGIACPGGTNCAPVSIFTAPELKREITWKMPPDLNDLNSQLKFEPTLFAFAYADFSLGDAFDVLRVKTFGMRAGPVLAASWTTPTVQVLDANYKSNYQSSIDFVVAAADHIKRLFNYLSIAEISLEYKQTSPLAQSPTAATATVDRDTFIEDDLLTFTVDLDLPNINFFPLVYNISEVRIYRRVTGPDGNPEAVQIASATGHAGQLRYTLSWLATEPGTVADEFFAFVKPEFLGLVSTLELGPVVAKEQQGKIAFTRSTFVDFNIGFINDIYVMNLDGTGVNQLTHDGMSICPSWSPDGSRIAFMRHGNAKLGVDSSDKDIVVMNADGSGAANLTPDILSFLGPPAWSPDGTRIAYRDAKGDAGGIILMNTDGSGKTGLATGLDRWVTVDNEMLAWSPDGARIAFDVPLSQNVSDVFAIDVDGTGLMNFTNGNIIHRAPSWSPDGTRIAMICADNNAGTSWVCVRNLDGTRQDFLETVGANAGRPSWSPDGRRIAFTRGTAEGVDVYVVSTDGTGMTRLTNGEGLHGCVAWSP